jgi:hypothetical protein
MVSLDARPCSCRIQIWSHMIVPMALARSFGPLLCCGCHHDPQHAVTFEHYTAKGIPALSYWGFEILFERNVLSTAGDMMLGVHVLDRSARFYKFTACFFNDELHI